MVNDSSQPLSARFKDTRVDQDAEKGQITHSESPMPDDSLGLSPSNITVRTESQPGSSKYAASTAGLEHKKGLLKAERKVYLKLDLLIVPVSIILYLSAYLDRGVSLAGEAAATTVAASLLAPINLYLTHTHTHNCRLLTGNIGNARLQGLETDVLGGDDKKFSLALACFYITYIVFAVPGTLLAKQILPSTSIAIGALTWSIAAACQAGAMNPAGLYVCRLFVGIGEAMFGQAMALYVKI